MLHACSSADPDSLSVPVPSACLCLYTPVTLSLCGFPIVMRVMNCMWLNPERMRLCALLPGLDAPLNQYPLSEWHLSGLDLLQLTSQDLGKLGVHKIGHQELILEAVEKLCSLVRS